MWIILGALCGFGLALVLWWHSVPTDVTVEDRFAIRQIWAPTFEAEVDLIQRVQQLVFDASPIHGGIANGQSREPADLITERRGLCYDRSRAIEKTLKSVGFQTRHVSMYESSIALVVPGYRSHALSEARTSRGWMLVDSMKPWLGLDASGAPISAKRLAQAKTPPDWEMPLTPDVVHVYGLFSRHGGFYPPFTPFPDVNWRQLMMNVVDPG